MDGNPPSSPNTSRVGGNMRSMADSPLSPWRAFLDTVRAQDPDHGGELVAETWLALCRRVGARDARYLRGMMRNLRRQQARGDGRRRRRESAWAEATAFPPSGPDDVLQRDEVARAVERALQRLDPESSQLLEERFVVGRSSSEIAAALGVAASTIRGRLRTTLERVRTLLREHIEPSLEPDEGLRHVVSEIEATLEALTSTWTGRLVLHLEPSAKRTRVAQLEFFPAASRTVQHDTRRRLEALPGCDVPGPFEMHFECSR